MHKYKNILLGDIILTNLLIHFKVSNYLMDLHLNYKVCNMGLKLKFLATDKTCTTNAKEKSVNSFLKLPAIGTHFTINISSYKSLHMALISLIPRII